MTLWETAYGWIQWDVLEDGRVFIQDIFVRPDYRRQGKGSAMLQTFCRERAAAGFQEVELDSVVLHDFFLKNGFRYRAADFDNSMVWRAPL